MSIPERQVLLEHVEFLRAIALGVLRNEADADDAVQQTLATALQKPPANDSNVRGWLATVVKNFARMQLRSRGRRRARERMAAQPEGAGPSPAQIAQRMEMERQVVDGIAGLEEPFRTTLILRYYDDLQPREIATRMDVPPATVRTRLKRGLDKLRADLEERNDGNRKATFAGLLLLAQLPTRAAPLPWIPLAGAAAIVACLVSLGVLVAQITDRPADTPRRSATMGDFPGREGEDAGEPDAPAVPCTVAGRVFDREGVALSGAEVIAYTHAGATLLDTPATRWRRWTETARPVARASTDATGAYALHIEPARPVWLVYRASGHCVKILPLPDARGAYEGVDVAIPRGQGARGTLYDARTDLPIADATVHVWGPEFSPFGAPALLSVTTDEQGAFRIPFAEIQPDGRTPMRVSLVVDARSSGFAPRVFQALPAAGLDLGLLRSEPLSIRTDPGARVMAIASKAMDVVVADAEGVARFPEFPDTVGSLIVTHPQRVARHERTWLRGEQEISVPLQPGELVQGTLRFADSDAPVAHARIGIVPGSHAQATLFDTLVAARTDKDGFFELRRRPGQGRELAVAHHSIGRVRTVRRREVVRMRADPAVQGRILDRAGEPVAGMRVRLEPHHWLSGWAGDEQRLWVAVTRADGRFEIRGAPRMDRVSVSVRHPRFEPQARKGEPGVHRHDFTVEPAARRASDDAPSATIVRGVVVDASGRALQGVEARAGDERSTSGPDGRFELRVRGPFPMRIALRRGEVVLEAEYPDAGTEPKLVMPEGPVLAGRVVHAGKPLAGARIRVFDDGAERESTRTDAAGRFALWRHRAVTPTAVVIEADGYRTVRLAPPLAAEIELSPAEPLVIRVVDEEGAAVPRVEVRVGERTGTTDAGGVLRWHRAAAERPSIEVVPGGPGWIAIGEPEWSEDEGSVRLVVGRGERIEGRIVDAQSRGIAHVVVRAEPRTPGHPARRAFTNSQGYFVLRGLHPGRYLLHVGDEEDGVEIEAGTTELVLRRETR